MGRKEVTVVINGEETVSRVAEEAGAGLTIFGRKIPFVIDATKLLDAAMNVLKGAFSAAKQYVLDSFAAYDDYAASQTKLAAQSKLTGVSLAELNRVAKDGREAFGLSTVVANDAAVTVAKYASRAGDATQSTRLLKAALDLGAASGLDAAASMDALEQGLRGQDEGFDKLLGKNPSAIWKEYADANGLAVGKMTDTEKRMAELTAVVEAGEKVQGSYNDRLQSGAGATDRLNVKMEDAKVAFGQAIQPLRIFIVQGLTNLVEVGGRVVLAIGRVANAIGIVLTGAIEGARSGVGYLAIGIGRLTGNKELEEWGSRQADAFSDFRTQLARLEAKYMTTGDAAQSAATRIEESSAKATAAVTKTTEVAEQKMDRLNQVLDQKLGRPMQLAIEMTAGAIGKLSDAARDQLPPETAERFVAHMQTLVVKADEARERMTGLRDTTGTASRNIKDTAGEVAMVARSALDAAVAFGVIEQSAANTLNSVINIAAGIAGTMSGDVTSGVAAILAGVTNIVAQMLGGDAARAKLIRDNNTELSRLRQELGNLSLDVTGETFSKVNSALAEVLPQLKGGRGARNTTDVVNALGARGLSMADLKKVAEELGIKIFSESGALSVDGLKQLFEAMGLVELGKFGGDFNSQLESVTKGFDVNQTGDLGQIQALGNLGGRFSSLFKDVIDVNDLAGTRKRLAALFARIQNGGLTADELGGLTGTQFLDLLTNIIGRIDQLKGGGAPRGGDSMAPPKDAGPTDPAGDTVDSGDGITLPKATVQEVIEAMDTNLGTILTAHTTLHERIAKATEESAVRLGSIDNKMDTLILVTEGQFVRIDRELAAMRVIASTSAGASRAF